MHRHQRIRKTFLAFSTSIFFLPEILLLSAPLTAPLLPLLPVRGVQAFTLAAVICSMGVFVLSLFLGRFYCSHVCPITGVFTLQAFLRKKNGKPAAEEMAFPSWFGTLMLILWIAAPAYVGLRALGNRFGFLPYHGVYSRWSVWAFYGLFALSGLLSRTVSKTSIAHYNCPLGPLMLAGIRLSAFVGLPSLRMGTDPLQCRSCGLCNKDCISARNVVQEVAGGTLNFEECVQCGTCAEQCPSGAITRQWTAGARHRSEITKIVK